MQFKQYILNGIGIYQDIKTQMEMQILTAKHGQRRIKGGATGAWAPGPPHLGAPHILEYFI